MCTQQMRLTACFSLFLTVFFASRTESQHVQDRHTVQADVSGFEDGAHHWYDINEEGKIIHPLPNRPRYAPTRIESIADNVLLYQKENGGWPKNYDMLAILTTEQKESLLKARYHTSSTFDNGATYSHVEYLAHAYTSTGNDVYKQACLRGIAFVLSAQYPNGGFPQFFPDTSGYRKHITFNDGAMIGVMKVLQNITRNKPHYAFISTTLREQVRRAFDRGVQCILRCQIVENETRTVWGQQHDHVDFRPRDARTFEKASICNGESAEIVLFLMSIENPSSSIVDAINDAVKWFSKSQIRGIRVKWVDSTTEQFRYHSTSKDVMVVTDSTAPAIWPRFSELGTHRPVLFTRNGKSVYSLAEVERERRTGYGWYTYAPQTVLDKYLQWKGMRDEEDEGKNQLEVPTRFSRDTSFTVASAYEKIKGEFPFARIVEPRKTIEITPLENLIYASYGNRKLYLDLFLPIKQKETPRPAVVLIHGGGWYSGDKSQQVPLAQEFAMRGYVAAAVEYRLSPEKKYPAAVFDLKAAIRWLRAHASEYGIDRNRIAALGCSAGGHLAAFLGVTGDHARFEGEGGNGSFSSSVQAVVDIDGILDFTHPAESGKDTVADKSSAGKRWLGASYKEDSRIWIDASPLTHVDGRSAPILFINSSIERFHAGRDEMIDKMRSLDIETKVKTIPNTPHTFWLFHPWFEQTIVYAVDFLERIFRR